MGVHLQLWPITVALSTYIYLDNSLTHHCSTSDSAASAIHASIGNVAAGSVFATLQSAAAGGYGVAALTGAAQAAGGAVAGAGGLSGITAYLYGKGKPQPDSTDEKENK